MMISRSGRVVTKEGGLATQNARAGTDQFMIDKARSMMQDLLDQ